jgi:hypothetical protein
VRLNYSLTACDGVPSNHNSTIFVSKSSYDDSIGSSPTCGSQVTDGEGGRRIGCWQIHNCGRKDDIWHQPGTLAGIFIGSTLVISLLMFVFIALVLRRRARRKVAQRIGSVDGEDGDVLRLEVGLGGEVLRKREGSEGNGKENAESFAESGRTHDGFMVQVDETGHGTMDQGNFGERSTATINCKEQDLTTEPRPINGNVDR